MTPAAACPLASSGSASVVARSHSPRYLITALTIVNSEAWLAAEGRESAGVGHRLVATADTSRAERVCPLCR